MTEKTKPFVSTLDLIKARQTEREREFDRGKTDVLIRIFERSLPFISDRTEKRKRLFSLISHPPSHHQKTAVSVFSPFSEIPSANIGVNR